MARRDGEAFTAFVLGVPARAAADGVSDVR